MHTIQKILIFLVGVLNENIGEWIEISELEAKFIESINGEIYFVGIKQYSTIKKG